MTTLSNISIFIQFIKSKYGCYIKKKGARSEEDVNREEAVKALFFDEDIIRKGLLADEMYLATWSKSEALKSKVRMYENKII